MMTPDCIGANLADTRVAGELAVESLRGEVVGIPEKDRQT